ncbi:hypothetical protein JAAARDRAFT_387716 [Jaapia argillacea MUCL 33604]|uniref:Uncharacterized protein n=1 Tax=Jaapia argillacea MUCL 33604 TaxID=933084 RepID=A0A067Q9Q4_9AGAM|nr:hypothetical protein JAAARDRAFT_387716 [Jaapia argillacea MUCL 33604]
MAGQHPRSRIDGPQPSHAPTAPSHSYKIYPISTSPKSSHSRSNSPTRQLLSPASVTDATMASQTLSARQREKQRQGGHNITLPAISLPPPDYASTSSLCLFADHSTPSASASHLAPLSTQPSLASTPLRSPLLSQAPPGSPPSSFPSRIESTSTCRLSPPSQSTPTQSILLTVNSNVNTSPFLQHQKSQKNRRRPGSRSSRRPRSRHASRPHTPNVSTYVCKALPYDAGFRPGVYVEYDDRKGTGRDHVEDDREESGEEEEEEEGEETRSRAEPRARERVNQGEKREKTGLFRKMRSIFSSASGNLPSKTHDPQSPSTPVFSLSFTSPAERSPEKRVLVSKSRRMALVRSLSWRVKSKDLVAGVGEGGR